MTSQRTICIFVGVGFSNAIFGQTLQNDIADDLLTRQASRQFLSRELVRLLREVKNIELVMSHFHNLAHSDQSKSNPNRYHNIRDIIFFRTAIAIYLRDNFHAVSTKYNNQRKTLIRNFFEHNRITKDNVFFVTTNYDLGIETMINDLFGGSGYYYPGKAFLKQSSRIGQIPIYKLHGSINWMENRGLSSDKGFTNKYRNNLKIDTDILETLKPAPLPGSRRLCLQHTDGNKYTPILIPFFYQKQEWLSQNPGWKLLFDNTWKQTRRYMEKTSKIYFWGYSLPAADHYLFTFLLNIMAPRTPTCIVVDKSSDRPLNTTLARMLRYCYQKKDNCYREFYEGLVKFLKNEGHEALRTHSS